MNIDDRVFQLFQFQFAFFDTPIPIIIYITIYISTSYILYKRLLYLQFINWNWNNWNSRSNWNTQVFFTFLPFLYQVFECPHQFVEHTECVTVDAEVPANLHRTEVRTERTVVPTGDRDVLTREHVRIALLDL